MKKILVTMALTIVLVLSGCGEKEPEFVIDENITQLEDEGYSKIGDIAYAKIEGNDDSQVIYLNFYKNSPESGIYTMGQFMEQFDYECEFVIKWNGKEYDSKDLEETEKIEDGIKLFPLEWQDILMDMSEKGYGADNLVTVATGSGIDDDVEKIVSDYLEKGELDVISKGEYDIDGEEISFLITKQGDELSFKIESSATTEEKAFLIFGAVAVEFQNLNDEFYGCSANIKYGDLYVLYQQYRNNVIVSGVNKDGSFTMEIPDWINKDINNLNMSDEDVKNYILDLESNMRDFGKISGYEMGYLLE